MRRASRNLVQLTGALFLSLVALHGSSNPLFAGNCPRVGALETVAETGASPVGSVCVTFRGLAASTGVSCFWDHPYRDPSAAWLAASLWDELLACRDGVRPGPDDRVNHPDSYDLKTLTVGENAYSVSLKDKGEEGRTLVFLRLERQTKTSPLSD